MYDRFIMGTACSHHRIGGDVQNYQRCMAEQEAIARSTAPVPEPIGVPFDLEMRMRVVCDAYHLAGDLAGYRACMHAQIAKLR